MLSPPGTDTAARQARFEAVYAAHHVPILGYALRRTTGQVIIWASPRQSWDGSERVSLPGSG